MVRYALSATAAGVFAGVIAVAPPIWSFAVTVGLAVGWCKWLEEHPDWSR